MCGRAYNKSSVVKSMERSIGKMKSEQEQMFEMFFTKRWWEGKTTLFISHIGTSIGTPSPHQGQPGSKLARNRPGLVQTGIERHSSSTVLTI
ncbi:hypothetical protein BU23DRAFT_81087 [Bimuria novae-zelandiae CBS 107.79]|uniref:Uncharacterized protein n=1 Tax=Bimuria novae-zelandiae CBS 107.79 TaxID=1447943 RepID=A0A6A5VDN9_9PLEO|nr:hypothetical protein BU23DRAFT_81087 [Bimuria novae-zelandiae CBS 107.79]